MTDFETIVDDFAFLEDWEERYKYIIDLGHRLDPLPEEDHVDEYKVRGCASQVWLKFKDTEDDTISFIGDSDAHIVRGLIALLISLYSGRKRDHILNTDAKEALARLDLEDHITPQRSNGLASMIATIRHRANNPH